MRKVCFLVFINLQTDRYKMNDTVDSLEELNDDLDIIDKDLNTNYILNRMPQQQRFCPNIINEPVVKQTTQFRLRDLREMITSMLPKQATPSVNRASRFATAKTTPNATPLHTVEQPDSEESESASSMMTESLEHSFESNRNGHQDRRDSRISRSIVQPDETLNSPIHLRAPDLFAQIMNQDNPVFTINGRNYKVDLKKEDYFVVVNLAGAQNQRAAEVEAQPTQIFRQSNTQFRNNRPSLQPSIGTLRRQLTSRSQHDVVRIPKQSTNELSECVSVCQSSSSRQPPSVITMNGIGNDFESTPPVQEQVVQSQQKVAHAPPVIIFGTVDDDPIADGHAKKKTKKGKKKSISINVQLPTKPDPAKNSALTSSMAAEEEKGDASNQSQANLTSQATFASTSLDINAIMDINKEMERKMSLQKEEARKRSETTKWLKPKAEEEAKLSLSPIMHAVTTGSLRKMQTQFVKDAPQPGQVRQLQNQLNQLKTQVNAQTSFKKAKLHIAFLFASPICHISPSPGGNIYQIIPALQVSKEVKKIKAAAKESNDGIIFKCAVATQSNFVNTLNKSPKIIHIACHGIPNNPSTMKDNYNDVKNEGDFLLFEHEESISELVSQKNLKNLIKQVWNTELVILAACDSEFAAKIFIQQGVKHVICIETSKEVLDQAMLTFSSQFYQSVFSGLSICEAYKIAQKLTSNQFKEREASIIKLLISDEYSSTGHKCFPIGFNHDENFQDISDKILVKWIPLKLDNLLFREKEMAQLVEKIMNGTKLVFVFGLVGIGKSCLTVNVMHFLKERKYFCGGLIFVSLNGTKTIEGLSHQLYSLIIKKLVLTDVNMADLAKKQDSKKEMLDFFIDIFNHNSPYKFKTEVKYKDRNLHTNIKTKKFLLCFDNAEDLIEVEKKEFKHFVLKLIHSCSNLQVIITSRKHLCQSTDNIDTDPMFIPALKGTKPVELFLNRVERHRQITTDEVVEIIKMDSNFEMETLLSSQKNQKLDLTIPKDVEKLKLLLRQRNKFIEALQLHDIFKTLLGNPLSITQLAACLSDPMRPRTLKDMYTLQQKGILDMDQFDEDGAQSPQNSKARIQRAATRPQINLNAKSVQTAIQSSVMLLAEHCPEAEQLLYFLSLLPHGVKLNQLKQMWDPQVDKTLAQIKQYEFLQISYKDDYFLTPLIVNYLHQTIEQEDKDNFMRKICAYFGDLLKRLYSIIARPNHTESSACFNPSHHIRQNELSYDSPQKMFEIKQKGSGTKTGELLTCLMSQLDQDSSQEQKTVLEESLQQILNIENCIEMLIQREKALSSPSYLISTDSDSIDGSSSFDDIDMQHLSEERKQTDNFLKIQVYKCSDNGDSDESPQQMDVIKRQNRRKSLTFMSKKNNNSRENESKFNNEASLIMSQIEEDALEQIDTPGSSNKNRRRKSSRNLSDSKGETLMRVSRRCSQLSGSSEKRKAQFAKPIALGNSRLNVREELSDASDSESEEEISEPKKSLINSDLEGFRSSGDQSELLLKLMVSHDQMSDLCSPLQSVGRPLKPALKNKNLLHSKTLPRQAFDSPSSFTKNTKLSKQSYHRALSGLPASPDESQLLKHQATRIFRLERKNDFSFNAPKRCLKIRSSNNSLKSFGKNSAFRQWTMDTDIMTETESFILYAIAVMYLSDSFQVSLDICNVDLKQSNIDESKFCQANTYRFKALNLEQIAIRIDINSELSQQRVSFLTDAVSSTRNAAKTFRQITIQEKPACVYGIALSKLQLGHLFSTYKQELGYIAIIKKNKNNLKNTIKHPKQREFSFNTRNRHAPSVFLNTQNGELLSLELAESYFAKAEKLFIKVHHLKGCQIACEQLLKLKPNDKEAKKRHKKYMKEDEQGCNEETKDHKPTFLLRRQGELISLMTELAIKCDLKKQYTEAELKATANFGQKQSSFKKTKSKFGSAIYVDDNKSEESPLFNGSNASPNSNNTLLDSVKDRRRSDKEKKVAFFNVDNVKSYGDCSSHASFESSSSPS